MPELCRSPLGLRGLKYHGGRRSPDKSGRSPLGLRGLKLNILDKASFASSKSQPSWAAWIEIVAQTEPSIYNAVAALLGCVD